uniref:Voltage-dependent calcium channel gamma-1 subunit n=1 Tax=Astyanax mexicanus TaxID=7994 RepID=A0A8B9JJ42_ASTMX
MAWCDRGIQVVLTTLGAFAAFSLMTVAIGTDYWLYSRAYICNSTNSSTDEADNLLQPKKSRGDLTHSGLWRICCIEDVNCSYFRHFNPGENSEIFEVKTQREYNISAAAIAVFSLAFMILGTLCLLGSVRKGKDYLHKPAGMFYAFAGLCTIISVEVMRQSVKRMIESKDTIWAEYYYSWSFACACTGFVLLFLSGIGLLIISMPQMPRNPWETCMDAEPEQI